ncbi:LysR family transcriptional regulator [Kribbella sp. NPDC056345]|uniref:LysR family transcriptional regulator n=1 Tax=Kribbella sp. NPDC056345 TaxID=3345789 RepID=UPI0035D5AF08
MELRHLRHFVALAEERSFTTAAQREHIVQSGLSTSIRALEKDVGALLFVRGTRPIRLTAEGEALVPSARRTLEAAAAARQTVQEVHGVLAGRLRIGALQSTGHTLPFASWLAEFSLAHPRVEIVVRFQAASEMLGRVIDGSLDIALAALIEDDPPGVDVVPLLAEPLMVACPAGHPLTRLPAARLDQLLDERFVEAPPEWSIRAVIDEAFASAGLQRQVAIEVNEWSMALDLIAAGAGIALVPQGLDFALHPRSTDTIQLVPLAGVQLERRVDLLLPSGHAATPAARRFAELVRSKVSSAASEPLAARPKG